MADRLGDMLVRRRVISSEQLQSALEEQSQTNKFLGEILAKRGYVLERQLLEILAEQFETRVVSLAETRINPDVIKLVPKSMAWEHKFMPIGIRNGVILIAVFNPLDMWPMSHLQSKLGLADVKFVLSEKEDILNSIIKHYGPEVL
jgi:hypothetical protein